MFDPVKSGNCLMQIMIRASMRTMQTQLEFLDWFEELSDGKHRQVTSSEQEREMIDARARHAERK